MARTEFLGLCDLNGARRRVNEDGTNYNDQEAHAY